MPTRYGAPGKDYCSSVARDALENRRARRSSDSRRKQLLHLGCRERISENADFIHHAVEQLKEPQIRVGADQKIIRVSSDQSSGAAGRGDELAVHVKKFGAD